MGPVAGSVAVRLTKDAAQTQFRKPSALSRSPSCCCCCSCCYLLLPVPRYRCSHLPCHLSLLAPRLAPEKFYNARPMCGAVSEAPADVCCACTASSSNAAV